MQVTISNVVNFKTPTFEHLLTSKIPERLAIGTSCLLHSSVKTSNQALSL